MCPAGYIYQRNATRGHCTCRIAPVPINNRNAWLYASNPLKAVCSSKDLTQRARRHSQFVLIFRLGRMVMMIEPSRVPIEFLYSPDHNGSVATIGLHQGANVSNYHRVSYFRWSESRSLRVTVGRTNVLDMMGRLIKIF